MEPLPVCSGEACASALRLMIYFRGWWWLCHLTQATPLSSLFALLMCSMTWMTSFFVACSICSANMSCFQFSFFLKSTWKYSKVYRKPFNFLTWIFTTWSEFLSLWTTNRTQSLRSTSEIIGKLQITGFPNRLLVFQTEAAEHSPVDHNLKWSPGLMNNTFLRSFARRHLLQYL